LGEALVVPEDVEAGIGKFALGDRHGNRVTCGLPGARRRRVGGREVQ
jgi:hypothetical protein